MGANSSKAKRPVKFLGQPFDVIIPVIGPTGVGKSTFINSLLDSSQIQVAVGHGLEPCTSQVNPIVIPFRSSPNQFLSPYGGKKGRLVMVDTPGFDDTYVDDEQILGDIVNWLANSYAQGKELGGVIYLYDIISTRTSSSNRGIRDTIQKYFGSKIPKRVVLGTTKWSLVRPEDGARRQKLIEKQFWNDMIEAGSKMVRVDVDPRSTSRGKETVAAREIVKGILLQVKR